MMRLSPAVATTDPKHEPTQPIRPKRRKRLVEEFALALLPTVTVLLVFALIQAFSRQKLLFASLASSAFLIYLDPGHRTNSIRTLLLSQAGAAAVGFALCWALGPGYLAGGISMILVIALMVLLDAVHPPAVSTALAFSFKEGPETNLALFGLALGMIVILVVLQRAMQWIVARWRQNQPEGA